MVRRRGGSVRKYTEDELYAMNKQQQVDLIRRLGGRDVKIPRLEKDRVKLILKLQG